MSTRNKGAAPHYGDRAITENRAVVTGRVVEETLTTWLFSDEHVECWLPKARCVWAPASNEMDMPLWMAIACKLV